MIKLKKKKGNNDFVLDFIVNKDCNNITIDYNKKFNDLRICYDSSLNPSII